MSDLNKIRNHIEEGKVKLISDCVHSALNSGHKPQSILKAMIKSMETVGKNFSEGKLFLPEIQNSTRAMRKGVEFLRPLLWETSPGACVIGSVEGDFHDVGKNMVLIMLESLGLEMIDLGVNVSKEEFIKAIEEKKDVVLVAASAFLPNNMPALKSTVKAVKARYSHIPVLVGGSFVTEELAKEIAADGFACDAVSSAAVGKRLISKEY